MTRVRTLKRPARAYILGMMVAGFSITAVLLWFDRGSLANTGDSAHAGDLFMVAFFVIFGLVASFSPVGTPGGVMLSVGLAPLYAAVLTLPAGPAALVAMLGSIDQRLPGRDIPWHRFLFNRALFGLVYGLSGSVFHVLVNLQAASGGAIGTSLKYVSAALIALVVIAVLNPPLVIAVVALTTGQPLRKIVYQGLQGLLLSYVGLAPVGGLIAYLVNGRNYGGIFMAASVSVLLFVYRELSKRSFKLETVAQGSYVAQSRLIDKKDRSTFGHSERVGVLAEAVAAKLRLSGDLTEQIRIGATLHDIGKIAIPDAILHKAGKLTDEEWELLKTHPIEGFEVLMEQPVLAQAAAIVRGHHENYDGTGYPDGLSGRAIPVGGRITRVVDSYDCMTNVRDYRAWVKPPFEALAELSALGGAHYDPEIVDTFIEVLMERSPDLSKSISGGAPVRREPGMIAALRNIPFLKLWTAQGLSNFGDMLTTTGLALTAYSASHSTLAVGLVFAARALPNLLLGLIAGQLVDRYDRKGLMLMMDLIRALLVASLPFLVTQSLALILVITFLVSTATVVFNPARSAVLPDILPFDLLQAGNSAVALAERTTEILGYVAAGAIIVLGGVPLVFAIDAMTFLLSAGLILTIRFPDMIPGNQKTSLRQIRDDVIVGLRQLRANPALRAIFPFSFFMVASGSALLPLMVPLAVDHLHAGNVGFALLEASLAVGATLGALFSGIIHTGRRGSLMVIGALGMGVCTVFAGLSPILPVTMIFFVAAGVANMVYIIPMITAIQEVTDSEVRGRVFAARFTLVQVGVLVGIAYAAIATSQFVPAAYVGVAVVASGTLMILVAVAGAINPALRRI
jgi:MFS family permease